MPAPRRKWRLCSEQLSWELTLAFQASFDHNRLADTGLVPLADERISRGGDRSSRWAPSWTHRRSTAASSPGSSWAPNASACSKLHGASSAAKWPMARCAQRSRTSKLRPATGASASSCTSGRPVPPACPPAEAFALFSIVTVNAYSLPLWTSGMVQTKGCGKPPRGTFSPTLGFRNSAEETGLFICTLIFTTAMERDSLPGA
mmetsp:Transcript_72808/g.224911  ORF Transcript_72808/g.224911 Transcript_72808/m.224911 type:complete len:203 (-) Transcript_72808:96-704(-)